MNLDDRRLDLLASHLLARFNCVVRSKSDVAAVEKVAAVFDVLRLFGVGVPTAASFLDDYWTTVGPVIFRPRGAQGPLGKDVRVLSHEVTHAVQFWRDPAGFVASYLTSRGRAELEAEAERGACEAWWELTGEVPGDLGALDVTRHGYAFDIGPADHDDFADLTRDILEQCLPTVKAGALGTDVGLAVREWVFGQHHQGASR